MLCLRTVVLMLVLSLLALLGCSQAQEPQKAPPPRVEQQQAPPPPVIFQDGPQIQLISTGLTLARGTITQDVTFLKPIGQVYDRQQFQVEIWSELPHTLTWPREAYVADYGLPLPEATAGNRQYNLYAWRYHAEDQKWHLVARTR